MRTPKKTETIELRLPYETKQAFMARCQARGVSASEALRGFIGETVEDRPARARRSPYARWGAVAAGAVLAAGALAQPALARAEASAGFARLDTDHDARVTVLEFVRAAELKLSVEHGAAATLPPDLRARILRQEFSRMDADRNGVVVIGEYRRYCAG